MDELTGRIERVTYTNEENGYTVAKIAVRGRRDPVTVVGAIPSPQPGQELQLKGEWTTHPRYGEQFQARHCSVSAPATAIALPCPLFFEPLALQSIKTLRRMVLKLQFGRTLIPPPAENSVPKLFPMQL